MHINYERQLSAQASLTIADQAIKHFNLQVEERHYGQALKTYQCKLIDNHQQLIFFGCGKGLGLQSKVSAYYEAIEHYAIHQFGQQAANQLNNYKLIETYQHPLPCVDVMSIHGNEKKAYPIFMLDPRYTKRQSVYDKTDYSNKAYLAHDSGTASGTNLTEASIHALNELIERDAYSLFLIEAFIKQKNQWIRLIDKSSLPASQQAIVKQIEQELNDDLMIFDMTSDVGIPAIYVSMTKQAFPMQPYGCGVSLHAEYALERALLESLQPIHIYNETLMNNQRDIVNQLTNYPLLLKAAIADVTSLKGLCQTVDFNSLPTDHERLSLADQLKTITRKIKQVGCDMYHLPISDLACGFVCVKYIIPEFESFHLVRTGKRVLPNKRGMRLLE